MLDKAFDALREKMLRDKLHDVITDPDQPPPTPKEQAFAALEKLGYLVDEDENDGFVYIMRGNQTIGELDYYEIKNGHVQCFLKTYTLLIWPLQLRTVK